MSKILNEKVQSVEKLAEGIYKMTIESPYVSQNAKPGQFVNIKCSEGINALLRRPISICSVDRKQNTFTIVFQLKGVGTELLSQKKKGDTVDFIGPLGKEFELSEAYQKIAVVGGGIGIFPLLNILKEKECRLKNAFIGFRSLDYMVLKENFEKYSSALHISTDDGSYGYKGLVTDLLENDIQKNNYDVIYTCGPMPMIKKVVEIANKYNIKCQVSMEQRMGCGIGACLVCACKTKLGDEWEYSHVCKDGPVFWSDEVIFD